jgi:nicotinamidase-related amidase
MSRDDTALLIVDVQERLLPAIPTASWLVWNIRRLLDAAQALDVRVVATEQYPRGLGPTVPELSAYLKEVPSKLRFSCGGCGPLMNELRVAGIRAVLVVGIEAHVCVQQSVLDLLSDGFRVFVAVDAVGARFEIDFETALRRMDSSGATLTTTEAAIFEWCEVAGSPEFKTISALIRETPPV